MAQPIAPIPLIAPPRPSLLEAIAAAKADFGDLSWDQKNTYLKSEYTGLPKLLRAVEPALLDQGIVIYSQFVYEEPFWRLRTTVGFKDGSEELFSDFLVTDTSNMHKFAGHYKLGTRYNLYALLEICPEKDDDGNETVYGNSPPVSTQLPGLPTLGSWPAPGQQAQTPQAVYPPPAPHPAAMAEWPMATNYATTPQGWPVISTMSPGMVNPVQPLPVLSQPS
jgi:hypothetical protein